MKKRIGSLLLAACLLVSLLPLGALAEEAEETTEAMVETQPAADPKAKSGTCGDGLTWVLEDRTLTISGSGEMDDGAPWAAHKSKVKKLVLTGGVTRVGEEAFYEFDRLESIDFGDSLVEIGARAFYGCTDLIIIHLPKSFRTFGEECFRDCYSLKKVYCDGGMPRFNSSCLWTGEYVAVYHPTNNVWPADAVNQLMSNFGGRLGVMMGDYDDSVLAELEQEDAEETEETEAPETEPEETQESTQAPAEAPTEAPTEEPTAATEPEIVYITTPATEETTEPVTEPQTEPSQPETEPVPTEEPEPEKPGGKSWIGLVMIAGVITFLVSGAMIFRSATKKGGRYGR